MGYKYILMEKFNNKIEKHLELSEIAEMLKEYKKYYNVSGYTGGLRTRTAGEMLERYPEEMIERSVWGMLPKGRLGRSIAKKLFVYRGSEHKHEAQKPEVLVWKK